MIMQSSRADDVKDFVQTRILFEQQTTYLLRHLTDLDTEDDWRHVPSGNNLGSAFNAYVKSIAQCLVSPDNEVQPSVAYYLALSDVVRHLPGRGSADSVHDLDTIVARFQVFYAEVKAQHARLLRYASA
jgi:hypothetical protein